MRSRAVLPGFPALEELHVDCNMSTLTNRMKVYSGTSNVNDALLLQLAGQSTKLRVLNLSGAPVTPAGLRQLAAAHAACRSAAAATAASGSGAAAVAAGAAASHAGPGSPTTAPPAGSAGPAAAAADGALRVHDLQIDGSALATDEGLVAIGQCCCDTLEQLVVRGAGRKLGDEGLRGLQACRHLSTLSITGSSVTEAGECAALCSCACHCHLFIGVGCAFG